MPEATSGFWPRDRPKRVDGAGIPRADTSSAGILHGSKTTHGYADGCLHARLIDEGGERRNDYGRAMVHLQP